MKDATPKIARAFRKVQRKLWGEERFFLLRASADQGVEGIPIGADPNGELAASNDQTGFYVSRPTRQGRLVVQVCEYGSITEEDLREFWAIGILEDGETSARVYELAGDVGVPGSPAARVWEFPCTFTVQTFTPSGSEFIPGVPVGVFPLAITRWEGYGG